MNWQGAGASGGAVQRTRLAFNLGGQCRKKTGLRAPGQQNEQPISVIIGNPPYNANASLNENDNNNEPGISLKCR